jgi:tetratricopeptide (TPR) repeat protein
VSRHFGWVMLSSLLALALSGPWDQGPCAQQAPGQIARVEDLASQSYTAFQSRSFDVAEVSAREAWKLSQGRPQGVAAGVAAANVGAALTLSAKLGEALEWQERAAEILRRENRQELLGRLAVARAITLYLLDRRADAIEMLIGARRVLGQKDWRSAFVDAGANGYSSDGLEVQFGYMAYRGLLSVAREEGDSLRTALCCMALGRLEGETGGHDKALDYYSAALRIFEARQDSAGAAVAVRNLGSAHRKLQQYAPAEEVLLSGLDRAERLGDRRLLVVVLDDLHLLYAETERYDRAREIDLRAKQTLEGIVDDIRRGRVADTLLLDLNQLVRKQYVNRPAYSTDVFRGILDQLALQVPK